MTAEDSIIEPRIGVSRTLLPLINSCNNYKPLTPGDLNLYEFLASNYMETHDVAQSKIVSTLASGLRDPLVYQWYYDDRQHLRTLSLPRFIAALRAKFLPRYWADDIEQSILLTSLQGWDEPVVQWTSKLRAQNVLLKGTKNHLSDTKLLVHLKTHLNKALVDMCSKDETLQMENDLDAWCEAIRALEDGKTMAGQKRPLGDSEESSSKRARLSIVGDHYVPQRDSISPASPHRRSHSPALVPKYPHFPLGRGDHYSRPFSSTPYRSDGLFKLTESERKWICAHDGCFKCRRIGVYHTSSACPNGHPKASRYQGITLADGFTLARGAPAKR
ncbi:hypothetical protein CPB85DRAFT_561898 [Mucidula mucida]|nr:hypothetical protein CPB85DRAFT_561898 [Mucidula mucida]